MLNKLFESGFIAVWCHFSVTTQDSNVLFVLKFTRFNKNSRYWIFVLFFLVSWGTSTGFLFAVRGFSTGVMTVWIQTSPPVHMSWVETEYPDPGSVQHSYIWCTFLFISSGLWGRHCVQAQTPHRSCSVGQHVVLSLQTGLVLFVTSCHTLVFWSDTYDEYTFECKLGLSADCSGDSVAAWTPFKPTPCSLTCTGPINQFKCLISVINPHFWGFSFSQKYRFFLNMFYGRNLVLHNHSEELENFELEESRFLLIVIIG